MKEDRRFDQAQRRRMRLGRTLVKRSVASIGMEGAHHSLLVWNSRRPEA
jgi:hypothetical protein